MPVAFAVSLQLLPRLPIIRKSFSPAGLAPADLTEHSLIALPVLDKAELHASGGQMLARTVRTSGSPGIPLQLLRCQRDQAEVSALWVRLFAAYARRTFDRQVNIGSGLRLQKRDLL